MANHITKGNSALTLFSIQDSNIEDKTKEMFMWRNFVNMFHYDPDAICNLVFINHPTETLVGVSVRCDSAVLDQKAIRYAEGMAFLLSNRFRNADIMAMSQEETLGVVRALSSLNGIPANLRDSTSHKLDGANDKLRMIFARVLDPQIILGKANEFCQKDRVRNSLESRIGVRAAWDERILLALPNPFLAYSFSYHALESTRDEAVAKSETDIPRQLDFVKPFLDAMGVPDMFLYKILKAKTSAEILDNNDVCLAPPKIIAEYILGYR